jgi:hypothetical protein
MKVRDNDSADIGASYSSLCKSCCNCIRLDFGGPKHVDQQSKWKIFDKAVVDQRKNLSMMFRKVEPTYCNREQKKIQNCKKNYCVY